MAGGANMTVRGMLGYRYAFGDMTPSSSLAFEGGAPFAVTGAPIARGAAASLKPA